MKGNGENTEQPGGGGGGGFIKRIRLHLERMEMRGEGKVVEMY